MQHKVLVKGEECSNSQELWKEMKWNSIKMRSSKALNNRTLSTVNISLVISLLVEETLKWKREEALLIRLKVKTFIIKSGLSGYSHLFIHSTLIWMLMKHLRSSLDLIFHSWISDLVFRELMKVSHSSFLRRMKSIILKGRT